MHFSSKMRDYIPKTFLSQIFHKNIILIETRLWSVWCISYVFSFSFHFLIILRRCPSLETSCYCLMSIQISNRQINNEDERESRKAGDRMYTVRFHPVQIPWNRFPYFGNYRHFGDVLHWWKRILLCFIPIFLHTFCVKCFKVIYCVETAKE